MWTPFQHRRDNIPPAPRSTTVRGGNSSITGLTQLERSRPLWGRLKYLVGVGILTTLLLYFSFAPTILSARTNASGAKAIHPLVPSVNASTAEEVVQVVHPVPLGTDIVKTATTVPSQVSTGGAEDAVQPVHSLQPGLQTGSSIPNSDFGVDSKELKDTESIPSFGLQVSDLPQTFLDAKALYSIPTAPAKGFLQHNVTVVTAYFDVPSKYSRKEYLVWMETMLCMDVPMVIFTEPGLVDRIFSVRAGLVPHADLKTVMVATTIEEFRVMNIANASEFWIQQAQMDRERGLHKGYKLLTIWDEKINFVTTVIDANPFGSEWFFWVDIGCMRWTARPCQCRFDQLPTPVITEQFSGESVTATYIAGDHTIAGGSFGGREQAMRRMETAFYKKMEHWRRKGKFVGKDQSLFNEMCLEEPDSFEMLDGGRNWSLVAEYVGGVRSEEPPVIHPCTASQLTI